MPDAQDSIVSVVVVAALLIMGVVVVGSVYGATPSQSETLTTNETVDYSTATTLDPGEDVDKWDDSVTINDSGGATLTEGTDYNWYSSNGTIEWLNTTETTDGETVTVTAGYESPYDTAESVMDTIGPSFELGGIVPIVIVAVSILGLLSMFGLNRRTNRR